MINDIRNLTRRNFLGLAGIATGGAALTGCATTHNYMVNTTSSGKKRQISDSSTVSISKSPDRRQATYDSLKPFQAQIAQDIGEKQVILKVNAGFPTEPHRNHSTYPDQVRGILDFLGEFYDGPVWIAEGVGSSKTDDMMDGYKLYGFMPIKKKYKNITLVDANRTPYQRKWIHQFKTRPMPINIISMYFDPANYIISASRMKTHNAVVGTFSLKNIIMGSPVGRHDGIASEKGKMHGGKGGEPGSGQELSYNMFRLAIQGVYPDLGVVDGVTGIEGDGPWDGSDVEHNISVASTDFVACDRICTELIGIDPFYMKYLEWCGDAGLGNWNRENIKVTGANLNDNIIKYKLNKNVENQIAWINENFERK